MSDRASDRATVEVERGSDGRVTARVHGELYDGRRLIKALLASTNGDDANGLGRDFDLDIKLGTLTGFNGEVLREVELKLSRRGGKTRDFALTAKFSDDAAVGGELHPDRDGHAMIEIESTDAGALFRLVDLYPRMSHGRMRLALYAQSRLRVLGYPG